MSTIIRPVAPGAWTGPRVDARSMAASAVVLAMANSAFGAGAGTLSGDCQLNTTASQVLSASSLQALVSDAGAANGEHVIDSVDPAQLPLGDPIVRRLRWWGLSLEFDPIGEVFIADCAADDLTPFRISLYQDNGIAGDHVRGALLSQTDVTPQIFDTGQLFNGFAVIQYEAILTIPYDDSSGDLAWIGIQRLAGNDAPGGNPCLFVWLDEESGAYGSESLQEGAATPEQTVDLAWCLSALPLQCPAEVVRSVGPLPRGVATADIDGVNGPDVVTSNFTGNSVSVLLNNGDGTFAPEAFYGTAPRPESVDVGDLDGINGPDIATANSQFSNVSILLNNGDGTFSADVVYPVGSVPRYIRIADMDGVNGPDLIVVNKFGNSISVLLNNGDGTVAPHVAYIVGSRPEGLTVGDLDGDLDIDVATVNSFDRSVSVLFNQGGVQAGTPGTLGPDVVYALGNAPIRLDLGDFDGDLDLDLVVGDIADDDISIMFNDGTGTFGPRTRYAAGDGTLGLAVGDVDLDLDLDVVATNRDSDDVSIMLNDGSGAFVESFLYATDNEPASVALADTDGDGLPNYIVSNRLANNVSILSENCFGACCTGVGQCEILVEEDCMALAGVYGGNGTGCGTSPSLCNNQCESAFVTAEGATGFTTIGASTDGPPLPPGCEGGGGSLLFIDDVWFSFTSTATGTLRVSTCNTADFNTRLAVYEGTCGNLTLLGCGDDLPGCAGQTSEIDVDVTVGQTVLIRVGGVTTQGTGALNLELLTGACCLANDTCLVAPRDFCLLAGGQYIGNETSCAGFSCSCPQDLSGNGQVDFADILAIIAAWGPCDGACLEDLSGNGVVDFADILEAIAVWGACG